PAGWLRYTSAAMIGALYLRTLERAERVYAAMEVRGYNGQLPTDAALRPKERFVVVMMCVIAFCLTVASYTNFGF
ncbi:MAG: CbiQ family ECF transporter T component, partial [Brasilonema sp.]